MQWWEGLIIFLIAGATLVVSSLIARYLYKKDNDFWLIYLFPVGWSALFTMVGFFLTIAAVIMGGTYP